MGSDAPDIDLPALYRRYGAVVYRRARRLLGDEPWAKDVTQEVFVRLWQAAPAPPADGVVPWLYRVTTNLCLNQRRDERRLSALHERAAASGAAAPALPIELVLRGIPEELHAVAIYYYIDQMSQTEIAEVLGLSQRTISNRLQQFRHVMAQSESPATPNAREVP